jgi:stage V sporulation protein G
VEITEVRIKLMDDAGDRLRAFCSITFDDSFVVRDLKIIDGSSGPFVAMPSRKLTAHCAGCGCKNHLRAAHCNQCGKKLPENQAAKDIDGRAKLYADIAHPINSACREQIQKHVIDAYQEELRMSAEPGYRSRYDDYFDAGEEGSSDDYDSEVSSAEDSAADDSAAGEAAKDSADAVAESAASSTKHTHIESAEPRPRGPHTGESKSTGPSTPHQKQKRTGFGEGIFE